jgi:hypothetical protein
MDMSFIVAACVLLLALVVGVILNGTEIRQRRGPRHDVPRQMKHGGQGRINRISGA